MCVTSPRRWLQVGVETLTIEDLGSFSYRVRCESSHLTSFSVLVDIDEVLLLSCRISSIMETLNEG